MYWSSVLHTHLTTHPRTIVISEAPPNYSALIALDRSHLREGPLRVSPSSLTAAATTASPAATTGVACVCVVPRSLAGLLVRPIISIFFILRKTSFIAIQKTGLE